MVKDTGDHLVIIWVPIGAPGGRNHYHTFHEWVYWLTGDFVNNEYTSPLQRIGDFQQFRKGVFLDRPAFSLGEHVRRDDDENDNTDNLLAYRTVDVGIGLPGTPQATERFPAVHHKGYERRNL